MGMSATLTAPPTPIGCCAAISLGALPELPSLRSALFLSHEPVGARPDGDLNVLGDRPNRSVRSTPYRLSPFVNTERSEQSHG
jgi:hypothetical protein